MWRANIPFTEKLLRLLFPIYLLTIVILTLIKGYELFASHHSWVMGDWLINYAGGFVRRGLIGEILTRIASPLHTSPGLLAFLLFSACYLGFFVFTYLIMLKRRFWMPFAPLLFSPYFLAFQVHQPSGGYRKEILFLFLLAFLGWGGQNWPKERFKKVTTLVLLLYPLLILTHEMLAAFLPALLGMVLLFIDVTDLSWREKGIWIAALFFSVLTFLKVVSLPPASTQQLSHIYTTLEHLGYAIDDTLNGGAILWLSKSLSQAQLHRQNLISLGKYYFKYPLVTALALLGFLPLLPTWQRLQKKPLTLSLLCISGIGTLILTHVAVDWGRFLYLNLEIFAFYTLLLKKDTPLKLNPIGQTIYLLLIVLYATGWHIPHCCEDSWKGTFFSYILLGFPSH